MEYEVKLRRPHPQQRKFVESKAKRKCIRAGRRGGKTTGAATVAVKAFLAGRRVLYATPTLEQVETFWQEVKRALASPIEAKVLYKNETRHIIEALGTETRIRAKTAWNADTLRGDYADLLILDEYQLMGADAWGLVGAPMLLDNDGDAIFIYTKKRGKHHSDELFKKARANTTGRWETFVFSSHENPFLSKVALDEITEDMTAVAYRMEILAEDIADDPDALWKRDIIEHVTAFPSLVTIVVGVDPPGTVTGAECGIVVAGAGIYEGQRHAYVLEDCSRRGTPAEWASAVVAAYHRHRANYVVAEVNFGGDMVRYTIQTIDADVPVRVRHAARAKNIRAEPVVAKYERGFVHHVGEHEELEDEMCNWVPGSGMPSPNRIDALVWAIRELKAGKKIVIQKRHDPKPSFGKPQYRGLRGTL